MTLSDDEVKMAVRVTKRMMSKGVVGAHHKQPQSVAKWFAVHERGEVKDVIDEMVSDREVPVREKGRGTVQLTDMGDAMAFLDKHGEDDPRGW